MTAVQLPNHSTQMCCPLLSSATLRLISSFSAITALADTRWNISGCCVNLCLLMLWSTWIKGSPFTHFPPGSDFNPFLGNRQFQTDLPGAGCFCMAENPWRTKLVTQSSELLLVELGGIAVWSCGEMIYFHLYSASQLLQRKPVRLKASYKNMSYIKPANYLILTHWGCYE